MHVASCVGDLCGIASEVVGVIVDVLDPSVGQVDRVVALPVEENVDNDVFAKCWKVVVPVASAIGRFPTCILCARVAVGHGIPELIGDLLVHDGVAVVTATSKNGASHVVSAGAATSNNGASSLSVAQVSLAKPGG